MNLREFLRQREKELADQMVELHRNLAQLETDLAIYQEAKAVVNRPLKEFTAGESACGDALAEYRTPSPASTVLRHFLAQHEEDLTAQINEIRINLMPLEAEFAEVRGAKVAIGLTQAYSGFKRLAAALGEFQQRAQQANIITLPSEPAEQTNNELIMLPAESPYSHLTMKQLVVKVLQEHFHNGATTRQMLDFFRHAWGRDIARTNLSPQLSRLFHDQIIGRRDDHIWFLLGQMNQEEPQIHSGGVLLGGSGNFRAG
jgi:hypothetical protein